MTAQQTINPWVNPSPALSSPGPLGFAPPAARVLPPSPGSVDAPAEGLPYTPVPAAEAAAARWWWAGCHGGAGVSTLTSAVPGTEAVRGWPVPVGGGHAWVVLVARTHAAGLLAAQRAAAQWASGVLPGGVELLGLVLVPDVPGRIPPPLRELAQLVRGGVPRSWLVPFLPELRFATDPRAAAAAAGELGALAALIEGARS